MTSIRAEQALAVHGISKRYGAVQAVADLSFTVQAGEILGLLGPNGAGKTTTIRMILDIIKPNGGQVSVLGGPMTEAKKSRIGYLPEVELWEARELQIKALSRGMQQKAQFVAGTMHEPDQHGGARVADWPQPGPALAHGGGHALADGTLIPRANAAERRVHLAAARVVGAEGLNER